VIDILGISFDLGIDPDKVSEEMMEFSSENSSDEFVEGWEDDFLEYMERKYSMGKKVSEVFMREMKEKK
jgi:hypothetical protein